VEDDRQTANNQVELYFSQPTPFSLLDISTDILSTSSHKWRYISLAELMLKRFLACIFFSGWCCEEGKFARTMHEVW